MSGTIKLDTVEMDAAAKGLGEIHKELKKEQIKLTADLAACIQPKSLAQTAVAEIHKARENVRLLALGCERQAETIQRRAALARLADGRASKADLAILIALSTGPNAVTAAKNPRLAKILAAIAANGGAKAEGTTRPDPRIARWAKYWTAANSAGGKKGGTFALSKAKVSAYVAGKAKWPAVQGLISAKAKDALKNPGNSRKTNGDANTPKTDDKPTPPYNPYPPGHPNYASWQSWLETMNAPPATPAPVPPPAAEEVTLGAEPGADPNATVSSQPGTVPSGTLGDPDVTTGAGTSDGTASDGLVA